MVGATREGVAGILLPLVVCGVRPKQSADDPYHEPDHSGHRKPDGFGVLVSVLDRVPPVDQVRHRPLGQLVGEKTGLRRLVEERPDSFAGPDLPQAMPERLFECPDSGGVRFASDQREEPVATDVELVVSQGREVDGDQ